MKLPARLQLVLIEGRLHLEVIFRSVEGDVASVTFDPSHQGECLSAVEELVCEAAAADPELGQLYRPLQRGEH